VFGNDAWTIAIKDLPYLKWGLSYQYGGGSSTGHGFTAKKEEYQQTDFNDYGR
jgi:hypothetical protein